MCLLQKWSITFAGLLLLNHVITYQTNLVSISIGHHSPEQLMHHISDYNYLIRSRRQVTTNAHKEKPKRKNGRKLFKNRKYCLNCLTDFKSKAYTLSDVCLNPLANITESEIRYLNMCPESSAYCQTEVYTVNGIFSGLERRCATICVPICFQRLD